MSGKHVSRVMALVVACCVATPALAELRICNEAPEEQSVAIGYLGAAGDWTSEGWWRIANGACATVYVDPFDQSVFYYRATVPGGTFDGDYAFCTTPDPFTIVGDSDCATRGFDRTRFREVETGGATDFTLTLLDPGAVGFEDAPHASEGMPLSVVADPAPPMMGDPFDQKGVFTGCTVSDDTGGTLCGFAADGWRWYAYADGGTPDAVLQDLAQWPAPLAVTFSGDQITLGDITVEIVLRSVVEIAEGDGFEAHRAGFQGVWRSADDPNVVLEIDGVNAVEHYDGGPATMMLTRFLPSCFEAPGRGVGWARTELETRETDCLIVVAFGGDTLMLSNPTRGNTLTYRRER